MEQLFLKHIFAGLLVSGVFVTPVHAESLPNLLSDLLANDNQISAAKADMEAATEAITSAEGSHYPALDITGTYGNERQLKPNATDTSFVSRELDFTVTQRLWDFGATDASIDTVKLQREQTGEALQTTQSGVLLRAFTAYVNVLRASQVLNFAIQSEDNVRRQTELEDALVESGAGATTDILQAKVQLAGAMAQRVRANGALEVAKNNFRGVFLKDPGSIDELKIPRLPLDRLPLTLEEAVETALNNSPVLKSSLLDSLIARETVRQTHASSYRPTVDGIVEYKLKEDVSATAGRQNETFAKIEVNFPFNLGMTAVNTIKATELAHASANYRYADAKTQIEVRARNAWQQLQTAQADADLLKNQANIAAAFLELAREERKLDRRSLLDVLSGEVGLINANSDAASAETDIAIATVTLLDVMGELTDDDLR